MTNKFENNTVQVLDQKVYYVFSKIHPSRRLPELPPIPIVFLHGAIVSHLYWMPTVKTLAENYDVYALDFPGHGRSSKPKDALTVVRQAEITAEWLQGMNFQKAIIAANSYGCEIAVELAIRYPEKVDSLILTAPASDPSEPTVRQQGMRLIRDAFFEKPMMGLVLLWDACFIGLHRGLQTCQYMVDYDYISRLPLVAQQTLVVRGTNDAVATQPWVERVTSLLPRGECVNIQGGPHDINFCCAEELSAVINGFLRNRTGSSEEATENTTLR